MTPFLPTIAWDDTLATGLPEVDAQHQKLFEIANRISTLRTNGATPEELTRVLADLHQYTVYHFGTEEELMTRYPVDEAHRKAHAHAHHGFVRQVERANKLAHSNPVVTIDLLHAFLAQWLLHHVANMDRRMGEEIQMLQEGVSPEDQMQRRDLHAETLIENISGVVSDLGDRTFQMLELNLQLQAEIERRKQMELELSQSKTRFRMVADHTHSWEYWQSPDGTINYMSPSCERVTGYTAAEFGADPDLMYRIIHPDDRHLMAQHREDVMVHEEDEDEIGFRIVRRDGDIRWIVHSCKTMFGPAGDFIGRRGSNRDITERQVSNDSMMLVAAVFESVNEAVLVTDADNRIIVVNTAFSNITGYGPEDVIGKEPGVLADEEPSADLVKSQWRKLTAKGRWQGEMINRRKNGELYSAAVSIDSVRDEHGEVSNFVLVFSDISERKASEQRIEFLAHHDQLTGLPNWVLFRERLQQAIESAGREGEQLALMYVDIDHFKQAKDRIGHDNGDLLLQEFARRLQACLRSGDSAARIGSDEFVVQIPQAGSMREVCAVATAIKSAMAAPFSLGRHTINISTSIGIALYPEHGDDAGQILKNADLALYQAKRAGGASICAYDPSDWAT